jgi:hypothetical protein
MWLQCAIAYLSEPQATRSLSLSTTWYAGADLLQGFSRLAHALSCSVRGVPASMSNHDQQPPSRVPCCLKSSAQYTICLSCRSEDFPPSHFSNGAPWACCFNLEVAPAPSQQELCLLVTTNSIKQVRAMISSSAPLSLPFQSPGCKRARSRFSIPVFSPNSLYKPPHQPKRQKLHSAVIPKV